MKVEILIKMNKNPSKLTTTTKNTDYVPSYKALSVNMRSI